LFSSRADPSETPTGGGDGRDAASAGRDKVGSDARSQSFRSKDSTTGARHPLVEGPTEICASSPPKQLAIKKKKKN